MAGPFAPAELSGHDVLFLYLGNEGIRVDQPGHDVESWFVG
jgi:hypothetical protein